MKRRKKIKEIRKNENEKLKLFKNIFNIIILK